MYIVCIFHMLPFLLQFECKFSLAKTMRACSIHFQLNETKNPKISQQNWRLLHPKKIREIQNEPFKVSPKKIEQDKIRVLFFFFFGGLFPMCSLRDPKMFSMRFPKWSPPQVPNGVPNSTLFSSHIFIVLAIIMVQLACKLLVKGGGGQLDA